MVPGQHHVRMNMYIAQASNGHFKIVKNLGVIDPKEAECPAPCRRRQDARGQLIKRAAGSDDSRGHAPRSCAWLQSSGPQDFALSRSCRARRVLSRRRVYGSFRGGWCGAMMAQAHNLKVAGSNPAPATKFAAKSKTWRRSYFDYVFNSPSGSTVEARGRVILSASKGWRLRQVDLRSLPKRTMADTQQRVEDM